MANLLKVDNLNFSYQDNKIFQNLSFVIEENTINAVLSSNNSGKTTLIKLLSGYLLFDGMVELNGVALNRKNYETYLKNIGIVLSRISLKFKDNDVHSFFVSKLHKNGYNRKEIKNILTEIDNLYDIGNLFRKKILNLSKKERIKVLIVLAVVHNPKLLLLDDIYDDLNNDESFEISLFLKKIVEQKKVTILFTTTKLDMCRSCNRIIFINDGKVQLEGDFDYISSHDNVLVRNGINISIMLDLSLKLKFYNLLDEAILEPDRMVDRLWQ